MTKREFKYEPPSQERESKSDRFRRVYNEELQKPPRRYSLPVRVVSGFVMALLVTIAVSALFGVAVLVFNWIASLL